MRPTEEKTSMHARMRGRRGHGGPPWLDADWRSGRGAWGGGRRRMRRGDIRTALLGALEDGPAHGYEVINRLEEKSGGMWRPSPGSVYPTLQMFEDEGLVRSEERDGKRVYELTDTGKAQASERAERLGAEPWNTGSDDESDFHSLVKSAASMMVAA